MLIFIYRKNLRPMPVHMKTVSAAVLSSTYCTKSFSVLFPTVNMTGKPKNLHSASYIEEVEVNANVSRLRKLPKMGR